MFPKKQTLDRVDTDKDVYTMALERIENTFTQFDHVIVGFSGGKDSTAVLNLALEVAHSDPKFERHLPLRAVHYDEEAVPYETEEYVRRVAQLPDVDLEWYCLPLKHRNACSRRSPWWWPWAPEAEELWCRPLPPEAITTLKGFPINPPQARLTAPDAQGLLAPPERGNTAMMMGIRAQESLIRMRAVTRRAHENYLVRSTDKTAKAGNVWKSYPIYDWRTEDVWTAPARLGWDYNHAYDRLEMAGVSHALQRCSPAFGEEPLEKLHTYASCFPEVWDKMVDRVPGVGAAVRYARTELYSYGSRPTKPPGMAWPDFLAHYLDKFPPAEARMVAEKIRTELATHYRKTTLPILVKAENPITGVSWNFLVGIATRGNFKNRKQAGFTILRDGQGRTLPRYWRKYATELAEVLAAGNLGEYAHPGRWPTDPQAIIPDYAKDGG